MEQHRPVHEEDDESEASTLETTVRVADLSENVQKMVVEDQRRRNEDYSQEKSRPKTRQRGIPTSGDLNAKQPRSNKKKTCVTGFGRGRVQWGTLNFGR